MKLNQLVGKTHALAPLFKGALKDYFGHFKNSQGMFKGERKTYNPRPDTVDEPKNRSFTAVQSTIKEHLDYFVKHQAPYVDAVLSIEATNSSGTAVAELIVEGESWGQFSSLELLRLRSIIEMQEFKVMHENIVVRSDAQVWKPTTDDMYAKREIFETELEKFEAKTTEKKSYIIPDPNIGKLTDQSRYTPQLGVENTTVILGEGTRQLFSGEWSQRQKAELLTRIATLKVALTEALEKCNQVEVVESKLTGNRLFNYLYT